MKLTKKSVCVYIENEAQLQEARELLSKYNQIEWEHTDAFNLKYNANYLVYSDTDNDWFITENIIETKITLQELETILKEQ